MRRAPFVRFLLVCAFTTLIFAPLAVVGEQKDSSEPASSSTDAVPVEAAKTADEPSKATEEPPASKGTEKDAAEAAEEEEEEDSGLFSGIVIAVLGVAAVGAGFAFLNGQEPGEKTRKKGSAVLLLGPSNAGKTSLYLTLKDGGVKTGTTTSMQENEGTFKFNKYEDEDAKPLHVIDFPGDASLSYRLPHFYPVAKVMVFMVDANDRKSIEREAAEIMYRVLTNPEVVELSPTIIVACNKSDLILASKPALLKKTFETELQKLTKTQGVAEDSVTDDADQKETIPLGVEGESFEFDKHSPCPVDFMKCSVSKGNLSELVERIREAMDI